MVGNGLDRSVLCVTVGRGLAPAVKMQNALPPFRHCFAMPPPLIVEAEKRRILSAPTVLKL